MKRTLLFDFNGVIVNDEPEHCQALLATLEECGIRIDRETYFREYLGLDDRACFRKAFRAEGRPEPAAFQLTDLVGRKSARYTQSIRESIALVPGARGFICQAAEEGFALGLVSGAPREEIQPVLVMARLESIFTCVVAAEDVSTGKPDPEGYLKALDLLASRPEEAMILEDSLPGLAASRAARVRCTMLTTSHRGESLAGADAIWENFLGRKPADLPWSNG